METTETTMAGLLERWHELEPERFALTTTKHSDHAYTWYRLILGDIRHTISVPLSARDKAILHAAVLEAVRAQGWDMVMTMTADGWVTVQVHDPEKCEYLSDVTEDDATLALLSAYVQALEARDA